MAHIKNTVKDFWNKVEKTSTCWIWNACRDKDGYGEFKFHMKKLKSHRFAWFISFGEIPKGMLVCHHCDNPSCVNPKHLFIGNHKDNAMDRSRKGRGFNRSGENNGMTRLKNAQISRIIELYDTGKYLQSELAGMFGVGQSHVSRILSHNVRQFI